MGTSGLMIRQLPPGFELSKAEAYSAAPPRLLSQRTGAGSTVSIGFSIIERLQEITKCAGVGERECFGKDGAKFALAGTSVPMRIARARWPVARRRTPWDRFCGQIHEAEGELEMG